MPAHDRASWLGERDLPTRAALFNLIVGQGARAGATQIMPFLADEADGWLPVYANTRSEAADRNSEPRLLSTRPP